MREWRAKRRKAGVVTDRPEATRASSSRGAVSARVQLHRKRKRGQVLPTICAACGIGRQVVGNRIDPDRPDAVVWACRGCRFEIIKGIKERRAAAEREAIERWERQVAANEMTAALALIESLVPAIADALRLAASRGPFGITLSPASPLFQQRLASLIALEMRRTPCTVYRKR